MYANARSSRTSRGATATNALPSHERRLYIGNLAKEVTEYMLIKLLERYGTVTKLDFLFHKEGALKGKPRGYCFAEFRTAQEARQVLNQLNGRKLHGRPLSIAWSQMHTQGTSHSARGTTPYEATSRAVSAALQRTQRMAQSSVDAKIQALERKLAHIQDTTEVESPATDNSGAVLPTPPLVNTRRRSGTNSVQSNPNNPLGH